MIESLFPTYSVDSRYCLLSKMAYIGLQHQASSFATHSFRVHMGPGVAIIPA
jgi:hypothetical protein